MSDDSKRAERFMVGTLMFCAFFPIAILFYDRTLLKDMSTGFLFWYPFILFFAVAYIYNKLTGKKK